MTSHMLAGRRADTDRRRERVLKAISDSVSTGGTVNVSAIARRAGVDRTFFYRHRDLLAQVHAAELAPTDAQGNTAGVTRASLQADLANAQERNGRLTTRVRQLETRLSELMGEQAWRESGLGSGADLDDLHRKINRLEQESVDLKAALEERTAELEAAREANRQLTRALNQGGTSRS
ncbi:DUF6262 family protein [Streptomyces sp. NPDC020096]